MQERLQKVLARAGFASRRGAEALMAEGRVTVNGEVVRELGTKADPATDDVRVDGVRVKAPASPVYIVLNKPRGVVTTRRDPAGRQTVMDLVPGVTGLFPVGRLDVTTEGLILLTNDGAFADRVAHPRYEVPRVYHAKVHRMPDARALERLEGGVTVEGQLLKADRVRVLDSGNNPWLEITLDEGKQHEVRRLLEAVGHPVSKLRRVAIGPVVARGLDVGHFRALRPEEVTGLLRGEGPPLAAVRPARRGVGPHRRPGPTRRAAGRGKAWQREGQRDEPRRGRSLGAKAVVRGKDASRGQDWQSRSHGARGSTSSIKGRGRQRRSGRLSGSHGSTSSVKGGGSQARGGRGSGSRGRRR